MRKSIYTHRTTPWMHALFPQGTWRLQNDNEIAITFDDGPHPEITPWVLEQLDNYKMKGTFFLVGDNVSKYPEVVQQIKEKGHQIGGHTTHHENYFRTNPASYFRSAIETQIQLDTQIFRPPYGRLGWKMSSKLLNLPYIQQIIFWTLLTGDFDRNLSPENCYNKIKKYLHGGDIIVFHDSEKAWPRLQYSLPRTLELIEKHNYTAHEFIL